MPRKQKKYHVIYKTTCKVNNKYYVGMHSTDDLNDGYIGSGKYLWNSIRKHGKENFEVEFLEFFENRKDLINHEIELVNEDLIKDPLCMNLKPGGRGGFVNEEHQRKFSLAGASTPGRTEKSNNTKRLRLQDPIYRKKYCDKLKARPKDKTGTGFQGLKHTDETKDKMSIKASQRIGSKNSQFGTCWITSSNTNKKIKKEELILYIQQGWIKGRVTKSNY